LRREPGKKVLFLGAAPFQLPPIHYALRCGYQVVTCDNRPDNPGHRLAHRSYDISTVDIGAVLRIAESEQVDGVLAYASDVSALTAAQVAGRLGLPGNPPAAVELLTRKDLFRDFLTRSGLQPLLHRSFGAGEQDAIRPYVERSARRMVIKPVDASGSKGVALLEPDGFDPLRVDQAFAESRSRTVVVEELIAKSGHQICGDGFVEDGELAFVDFGDGHFYDDGRFLAPFAETFPSLHPRSVLTRVHQALARILRATGYRRGPINLDVLITASGEPFVVEIGPRAGGNFIPTAISLRTGTDLVAAAVESCLDPAYRLPRRREPPAGHVACYMVHSRTGGIFQGLRLGEELRRHLVATHLYLEPGGRVGPFLKASEAVGNLILRFDSAAQMHRMIRDMPAHCRVDWAPAPASREVGAPR
jgi:biotin carboxylase